MGLLSSRINYMFALSILFAFEFLSNMMVTFVGELPGLLFAFAVNGVCIGFVDGILNFIFLLLWGRQAMPFVQIAYFIMGCGMISAPVLSKLFLSVPLDEVVMVGVEFTENSETRVTRLYLIVAVFQGINAGIFLIVWFFYPETTDHPSRLKQDTGEESESSDAGSKRRWRIIVVILHLICMHVYYGVEVSFGSYLTAYSVQIGLTKADGAQLTTLFWSTFTVFKAVAILYIPWIGYASNTLLGLTVMLVGSVLLLPFGGSSSSDTRLLSAGVGMTGTGLSVIYSSTLLFLEEYMPITGVLGSLMCVSVAMGEFTFPALISLFIESYPTMLMWTGLFSAVTMILAFSLIVVICRNKLTTQTQASISIGHVQPTAETDVEKNIDSRG